MQKDSIEALRQNNVDIAKILLTLYLRVPVLLLGLCPTV